MKYLTTDQVQQQLKAGRSIEQWLGVLTKSNYRSITWLRIDQESNGTYSIAKFESFDDENPEMLDIYSFEKVDPDLPYGEIVNAATPTDALEIAENAFKAEQSKYVGSGMIQDVYAEFLSEYGQFSS